MLIRILSLLVDNSKTINNIIIYSTLIWVNFVLLVPQSDLLSSRFALVYRATLFYPTVGHFSTICPGIIQRRPDVLCGDTFKKNLSNTAFFIRDLLIIIQLFQEQW